MIKFSVPCLRRAIALCAVAVATSLLSAPAAFAQSPMMGGGGQPSPRNMEAELGITPAQKARIQAIQKKYQPQVTAIQKKYQPQVTAIQKKYQPQFAALQKRYVGDIQPIAKKIDKEIEGVLTPAQRAKVKQMQAQQRGMAGGAGGVGMGR